MYHLKGQKFGRLLVLERSDVTDKKHNIFWKCNCECGSIVYVRASDLVSGHTNSCGCYQKDQAQKSLINIRKRNPNFHQTKNRTYRSWKAMMQRCYDLNFKFYKYYGGRGIIVCDEWHDFRNFKKDMGEAPDNLTLDRIDPNGNYCKSNCRWITMKEQNNNRRPCCFIHYNGIKYSAKTFSERFSLNYNKTLKAYHLGLAPSEIMAFARS